MKALVVRAQNLDHILHGRQKVLLKGWKTNHRGTLLLYGAQKDKHRLAGIAACTVNIVGCRPMREEDALLAYADYRSNLWTWLFIHVRRIKPLEVLTGTTRIFELPIPEEWLEDAPR